MRHMEATHHFCLKRMQSLPLRTRSDMVKGLLGYTSIEAYIDQQKLNFLGSICRMKSSDVVMKVFLNRLTQYRNNCSKTHSGFIPDIVNILDKYTTLKRQ
jgi:hypothetical protein